MDKNMQMILGFFVLLIVGIPLLTMISYNTDKMSQTETVKGDQFTISNTSCTQITTGCITTLSSVENLTGVYINPANYSLCAVGKTPPSYNGISLIGTDSWLNSQINGKTVYANYTQSSDCFYVSDTTSLNLVKLAPIFFVLALICMGIFYVWKNGIDGLMGGK